MQNVQEISLIKPKGYYTKQLAFLQKTTVKFSRNKKGIKKQNKQICKQSRQKKKIYIKQLQIIKKQLEKQVLSLKNENVQLKNALRQKQKTQMLDRMQFTYKKIIKELVEEYRYMVQAIDNQDQSAIKRSLAVLRAQFSISGKDRKILINQSINQLLSFTMPMHFRILMQNCEDNHKFYYNLIGVAKQNKPYLLTLSEDKKLILKQMKPKIKQAKDNFNNILLKLHEVHKEIDKYGEEYQKIIDQIQNKVNHPLFIANLLLNLDKQRNSTGQIYPINFYKTIQNIQTNVNYNYNNGGGDYIFEEEQNMAFQQFFIDDL